MFAYALNHDSLLLLVLLRMAAFVGTSPLLSFPLWPNWAKLGFAVYVSVLVTPTAAGTAAFVPSVANAPGLFVVAGLQQTLIGMALGFMGTLVFSALSIAGQMIDVPIGFASAVLYNPQESQSTGLTATMNSLLFTLYFIGLHGVDGLVMAIMNSYQMIGIGHFHWPASLSSLLVGVLGLTMTFAVQMAAPLLVALLLVNVTFALLSRAVPQMNVFVVGLPAQLLVGLVLLAAVMPGLVYLFGNLFAAMFEQMNHVLTVFAHP